MVDICWEKKKILDLGDVVTGTTPPADNPEYFGDKYPFITPTDMLYSKRRIVTERHISQKGFENLRKKSLPKNSICYTCIGATIGKMCLTSETSVTNQQINSIIPNPENNAFFVYYLLLNLKEEIKAIASGAATPIINKSSFSSIEIKVPPKDTQEIIAKILSSFDDLIEINSSMVAVLEEMASCIYNEWFINLRFPGYETAETIKTQSGSMPVGWEIRKLSDLVTTQYGYTESAQCKPIGPKFLRGMDINKNSFVNWSEVPYCPVNEENHEKYRLCKGDIVVIRMADPGKAGIVEQDIDAVFASYLIRLKLKSDKISPYYLYYFLMSEVYQNYIKGVSTGTTRDCASSDVLVGTQILVPPKNLLNLFECAISAMRTLLNTLIEENSSLHKMRDLVLPELFSKGLNENSDNLN